LLKGIRFQSGGILKSFTSGQYSLTVHPSDGQCGLSPMITRQLSLQPKGYGSSQSVVLGPNKEKAARLSVFDNGPTSEDLFIRNLSWNTFTVDLGIYPGASAERQQLTLYPRASRAIQSDFDDTATFSLRATALTGQKIRARGGVGQSKATVVYVVGSPRNGFFTIQENVKTGGQAGPRLSLSFVHGFNGEEVQTKRAFPVDISLNGRCVAKGVHFKSSLQIASVEAGTHNVTVHRSNGRCSNPEIANTQIALAESDIDYLSYRSILLAPFSRGKVTPILSVLHNLSTTEELQVQNLLKVPFNLSLEITNRDGTSNTINAVNRGRGATSSFPLSHRLSSQFSLRATDPAGRVTRMNAPVKLGETSVIYLVGSQRYGYEAIPHSVMQDHLVSPLKAAPEVKGE
jgi:hypothetical protein